MKIIFFSCISLNLYLFRFGLIKYLQGMGYDVTVAAGYDKYSNKLIKAGVKFINLKINRKGVNPIKDIILFFNIIKIILNEKADIVINYTIKPVIYTSLAGWFLKTKIINVITGLGYVFIKKSILEKLVRIFYKIAFIRVNKVIFQNNDDLKFFLDEKIVSKEKSGVILSSGVNTAYYAPVKIKNRTKAVTFLFIGRLLWDKGIREFIESAEIVKKKFPEAKFDILGWLDKGNPSAVSKAYIKEKSGVINYLGITEDVRDYIGKTDVVVLPSYREGVPRSLLEAASMEKPLITTDAVGCREVVDNNINGLLVTVKDVKSLSNAIIWMIKNPQKRVKMGRNGRKKMIKEFDEKIVVKKYYKVIMDTLNKS